MTAQGKPPVGGRKLTKWLAWVGVGFIGGLMLASAWQLLSDKGRGQFERSLAMRDQAVQLLEDTYAKTQTTGSQAAMAAPPEQMAQYVELLRQALEQARHMRSEDLAAIHPDLPRLYRDEFAAGLDLMILGYEKKDPRMYFQGQILDRKFDIWRRNAGLGPR